jgi:hypothetical protein
MNDQSCVKTVRTSGDFKAQTLKQSAYSVYRSHLLLGYFIIRVN